MALASGAHIKIGSYEYLLEESMENHYNHRFEPNQLSSSQIVGDPTKYSPRPEKMYWEMTDWGGGEGNRIYYADDPLVYQKSDGLNGRIRGQLTGRPARARTTVTSEDQRKRGFLCVAQSSLWLAQARDTMNWSDDGVTWTGGTHGDVKTQANIGLNALSANYLMTAVAGDMDYLYYAAWHSGASGTRVVKRIQRSGGSTTIVAEQTGAVAYAGLAVLGGMLYLWTGHKLYSLDPTASMPATPTRVSPSLSEAPTGTVFGTNYWANCIATESSVVAFYTTDAQSFVYEFNPERGFYQLWKAPYGFSIKCMTYENGILYFAGHWGGDSNANGYGAMYAMRLRDRQPVHIGYFRKPDALNLQMQEMCTSYGSQIMVAAARTGRIFIYDTEMDSISMLDDLDTSRGTGGLNENNTDALSFASNDNRISDMITYGNKRVVMVYRPGAGAAGTTIQMVSYDDDEPDNRQAGNSTSAITSPLLHGEHDFDVPFEAKRLNGFHLGYKVENTGTTSGLKAGQSIKIEYSIDGGSYVTAATVDSSTTPSSGVQGRHFVAVSSGSSTTKFFSIRVRTSLTGTRTGGVDIQPPINYALTVEAELAAYTEVWDLLVRVKDEQPQTRPSNRSWHGPTTRGYLEDLVQNRNQVTFRDGYRYQARGSYDSYSVTVDGAIDVIERHAEGVMRVRLRAASS